MADAARSAPPGCAPKSGDPIHLAVDRHPGALLDALRDELPSALARGRAAEWAAAGHAIVDLLAGLVEHRLHLVEEESNA